MKLKEFMEMLKEASVYVKRENDPILATATSCLTPSGNGIVCQLCLTADGEVSADQTAISIRFEVERSK